MGTRVCSCIRVQSRAGADDALMRGMCASATRSLRKATNRWNTHRHSVRIHNACMYLYPCASCYPDERIADAGPATRTRARAASVCVRACVCDWAPTHPRRHVRAPSVGVDRGWLGAQAFHSAKALNANIGAWNTASVTTLIMVCAAFSARRRATAAGLAVRVVDVARAVVRGSAADASARVCAHAHARLSTCVGIAERTKDGIYV